eukprot:362822-Chlamydomonas_euryale.AAC.2
MARHTPTATGCLARNMLNRPGSTADALLLAQSVVCDELGNREHRNELGKLPVPFLKIATGYGCVWWQNIRAGAWCPSFQGEGDELVPSFQYLEAKPKGLGGDELVDVRVVYEETSVDLAHAAIRLADGFASQVRDTAGSDQGVGVMVHARLAKPP